MLLYQSRLTVTQMNECGMLEKGLNSPAFHAGIHGFESRTCHSFGSLAQLGERLPYKQNVGGSIPSTPIFFYAGVAQLAEQLICNQQVAGSSPITGSQEDNFERGCLFFVAVILQF